MNNLNTADPTFIVEIESRKICKINKELVIACQSNPIGRQIDDIIHIENNISQNVVAAFFNNRWYTLTQETVLWEESPHLKISLQNRDNIPDFDTIHTLNNMIGFLLHRIRSPLTGIQGYAEFIKDSVEDSSTSKYIDKIEGGVDELFAILDELETLENIPEKPVEMNNFSACPEKIVQKVLSSYDAKIREKTSIDLTKESILHCNPGDLRRILSILVENAIVHAPIDDHEITISQPSPNAIKISHDGSPVPKSVSKELFYPFVTTKARRLGIGLTIAILYAKRYRGSIFLTDNIPFKNVSLTLCLPPPKTSHTYSLFS